MSLFDLLFPKKTQPTTPLQSFKMLNGYTPVFHSWGGRLYESELVRTAIDAKARHISRLLVKVDGSPQMSLVSSLKKKPNKFQTWSQFLYRVSTILDVRNTCFVIPTRDKYGEKTGIYPILPDSWELVREKEHPDSLWIRFTFSDGHKGAEHLDDVGILTRFQYSSDIFGESNRALDETMQLISIQRQGIEEYTKNASSYRFMAKLTNFAKAEDMAKERQRFDVENFQSDNGGGILLFPNTYSDIKQLTGSNFTVDSEQMTLIQKNVYNYFGVNEDVIQNKAYGDGLDAFYNGAVVPFTTQLSEVLTKVLFTDREQSYGAKIWFMKDALNALSGESKLKASEGLLDRGILSINEVREMWGLPPVEGGDSRVIRGEYYDATTGEKLGVEKGETEDDE